MSDPETSYLRSLFVKTFVVYWLGLAVMLAALPITFPLLANNEIHHANGFLVPKIREVAIQLGTSSSQDELRMKAGVIAETIAKEEFLELRLYDERGRQLLGGDEHAGLREFLLQSRTQPHLMGQRSNGRDLIGMERFFVDGAAYEIAFTRPIETYRIILTLFTEPEPQRAMITAMGLGALVSLGLAIHLTTPLRRLAETARRVRGENLGVRVDPRVTKRRDEVGEVAREFDRALDRIEAADQNRKTLLRDVSHELRAPLTRLQLATSIATRIQRSEGTKVSPELAQVRREGERLDQLISQLLELSRMEFKSGQERSRIQLDEIVSTVVEDAKPLAEARGSEVELRECPAVQIDGEAYSISAAIDNLVRNALLHTPRGTRVCVSVEGPADGRVRISVVDDGPGVDPEIEDRMFEPFVSGTNDDHAGTGVGLALVKRAVEAHGGTIEARTPAGVSGLAMVISLPIT